MEDSILKRNIAIYLIILNHLGKKYILLSQNSQSFDDSIGQRRLPRYELNNIKEVGVFQIAMIDKLSGLKLDKDKFIPITYQNEDIVIRSTKWEAFIKVYLIEEEITDAIFERWQVRNQEGDSYYQLVSFTDLPYLTMQDPFSHIAQNLYVIHDKKSFCPACGGIGFLGNGDSCDCPYCLGYDYFGRYPTRKDDGVYNYFTGEVDSEEKFNKWTKSFKGFW